MSPKKHIAILNIKERDIKRFWSKVDKGDGTLTECWEWLGTKIVEGYGTFSIKNIEVKCHRLSFFLHTGVLNKSLCVCHLCDNPSCVNPNHLWLGTLQANNFDKTLKGRTAKGSMFVNKTLLNEKDVKDILIRLRNKESCVSIAKDYPASVQAISHIKAGRSWKHVTLS
jgi:hypothetical protein